MIITFTHVNGRVETVRVDGRPYISIEEHYRRIAEIHAAEREARADTVPAEEASDA